MGTAISRVAPGTKIKTMMTPAEVSLKVGTPDSVCAMTRRGSNQVLSIRPGTDQSVTITRDGYGSATSSTDGISVRGNLNVSSTGGGVTAAYIGGNVTLGGDAPIISGPVVKPEPDENFPYTIYAPAGTVVQFCDGEGQVLTSTIAV